MALFGTDGARGVANQELSPILALAIGGAAAAQLGRGRRVLVGRDPRVSSPMLEAAVVAGLSAGGIEVLRVGMLPTPALAHLIPEFHGDAGVMISASHNPPEYNGIKLLDRFGRKWSTEAESEVESRVAKEPHFVAAEAIGPVRDVARQGLKRYNDYVVEHFLGTLPPLYVIADLAHGAASATAPVVLRRLGLRVETLSRQADGTRINVGCGATHPGALAAQVTARGADLGLAFDGDADRLIAVDHTGRIVDGDAVLAILATGWKATGWLKGGRVAATVMTNLGIEQGLAAEGITVARTPVGDRWVAEAMRQADIVLGGEQSGHIICKLWAETGDGLLTALALIREMGRRGQPLATLADMWQRYPQVLKNVRLARLPGSWQEIPGLMESVAEAEAALGHEGRVLIRPSGTEPLLRVMVEGKDAALIESWAERLVGVAIKALETAGTH